MSHLARSDDLLHKAQLTYQDRMKFDLDTRSLWPAPKPAVAASSSAAAAAAAVNPVFAKAAAVGAARSSKELDVAKYAAIPSTFGGFPLAWAAGGAARAMWETLATDIGLTAVNFSARSVGRATDEMVAGAIAALKAELLEDVVSKGSQLTVTMDGSSRHKRRFIAVTAHWLKVVVGNAGRPVGLALQSAVLRCSQAVGSHTSEFMRAFLLETLKDVGLAEKHVFASTMDNAAVNDLATLESVNEFFCVAHTASLMLEDVYKADGSVFKRVYDALHAVNVTIRGSPLRCEALLKVQEEAGIKPPLMPFVAPETRFIYRALESERTLKLLDSMVRMPMVSWSLGDRNRFQAELNAAGEVAEVAKEILPVLRSVNSFIVAMSSSSEPLISAIFSGVRMMQAEVQRVRAATVLPDVTSFCGAMEVALQARFGVWSTDPYSRLALYLDPWQLLQLPLPEISGVVKAGSFYDHFYRTCLSR